MKTYYDEWLGQDVEVEECERYTVGYNGCYYSDDSDGWNSHDYNCWEDAIAEYNALRSVVVPDVYLKDNEYCVTLQDDEWN